MEIFQNPEIVDTALETVALYGMLDKEFAKENKAFFFANVSTFFLNFVSLFSCFNYFNHKDIIRLFTTFLMLN